MRLEGFFITVGRTHVWSETRETCEILTSAPRLHKDPQIRTGREIKIKDNADVQGQVERMRMCWQGADKSGCHFCAPIAAIGKSGVKLVSLPLWFHTQRHRAAPSSRREKKKKKDPGGLILGGNLKYHNPSGS